MAGPAKSDTASWVIVIVTIALAAGSGLVAWGSVSATQITQGQQIAELMVNVSTLQAGFSDLKSGMVDIKRCVADHSKCE